YANIPGDEPGPCPGDNVSGTVVAVDPSTNMVKIDTGDGLCTVTLDGSYDHPIVTLLGAYFGDVSVKTLEAALQDTTGCALYDDISGTWAWADCESDGAVPVRITGEDDAGNFLAVNLKDNSVITISIADEETANRVRNALGVLVVDWPLEDGDLVQVSDDVARYHDEGTGFGVLVKLYSLSNATGVPVEQLLEEFRSGTGIGQLFKTHGKPPQLGVGHVRQEMKQGGESIPDQDAQPSENGNGKDKDKGKKEKTKNKTTGICNAKAKGGKAKGKGDVTCPPLP
ncbi:MAG: hypothetical protein PVF74_00300, partial [Anaerolineales bacterium]